MKIFEDRINKETKEWAIPEEEIKQWVDLRNWRIWTCDPITAKDLDDSLSLEHIEGDIWEIGVHIADVSYFLVQGSALDKEALSRGSSVYFPNIVIPMLPRLLCENLCSLNPNVERLAYTCFFWIKENGDLVDYEPRIHRSVIKSCAKWNYELVQDILDWKITELSQIDEKYYPQNHDFKDMVADCFKFNEIALAWRKKRLANGAITLENAQYYFALGDDQMPTSFEEQKRMDSKNLIEEYMLLANKFVAEFIVKFCKDKAVIWNQLPPKEEKIALF